MTARVFEFRASSLAKPDRPRGVNGDQARGKPAEPFSAGTWGRVCSKESLAARGGSTAPHVHSPRPAPCCLPRTEHRAGSMGTRAGRKLDVRGVAWVRLKAAAPTVAAFVTMCCPGRCPTAGSAVHEVGHRMKPPPQQGLSGSPESDSNRRPLPYHGSALPTELSGRAAPHYRTPVEHCSARSRGPLATQRLASERPGEVRLPAFLRSCSPQRALRHWSPKE
jgi:hypothetical protein